VVPLADSLYHRLRCFHPSGIRGIHLPKPKKL
jgi:hypothetical protein